jgi:UDP-glucose 4-epimerase
MVTSLVTGGAGFIGSHIVRALLAEGKKVRVLDNFSTGKWENLDDLDGKIEVLEGDLQDPARVVEAVKGVDIIYHQAALVSVALSMEDPEACYEINVHGTIGLMDAAREAGVQKMVLASSAAVYGESEVFPLTEAVTSPPLSPYAASKLVNEVYARLYTDIFNFPVVALRYFNVYGPRQAPDSDYAAAIPIFIRLLLNGKAPMIFGDGNQVRDFVFVEDIVRANLAAAASPEANGKVLNICTGQETKIIDLLETLIPMIAPGTAPKYAPPRAGDIYKSIGDPSLARQTMAYFAQTSLADGLDRTVAWMR